MFLLQFFRCFRWEGSFTFRKFICRTPFKLQPKLNVRVWEIELPFVIEIFGSFRPCGNAHTRLPHDGAVQKRGQSDSVISSGLQIFKFCSEKSFILSLVKDSIVVVGDAWDFVVQKCLMLRIDFFRQNRIDLCCEDRFSLKGRSDVPSYFWFFKFQCQICGTAQSRSLSRKINCC